MSELKKIQWLNTDLYFWLFLYFSNALSAVKIHINLKGDEKMEAMLSSH